MGKEGERERNEGKRKATTQESNGSVGRKEGREILWERSLLSLPKDVKVNIVVVLGRDKVSLYILRIYPLALLVRI